MGIGQPRIVALSGGIGGAKLLLGLDHYLAEGELSAIVNTGDDFEHFGLYICPDLDTALYTLSGLSHPEQGWGRRDETWSFMQTMRDIGADDWFNLGDRDLALHVWRSERLRCGDSLTQVTAQVCDRLRLKAELVPMCDQPVRTMINTELGEIGFQEYFVKRHCAPSVRSIRFAGADTALATAALTALDSPRLEAIIICPSNPYLSVDPILAVPGIRAALINRRVPAIAVSPLIGSRAVKGPTAKIMAELGMAVSNDSIAAHYSGLVDALLIDEQDAASVGGWSLRSHATNTLMNTLDDKRRVAKAVLALAGRKNS
jgi:LPPG:FO 2-phospho-L-lactate transferase